MEPYDALIQGQFSNRIRGLRQLGGRYLGADFSLTEQPVAWSLQLGRYVGAYGGQSVDISGYWIFRGDGLHQCWQAERRGGGKLRYWNDDGLAQGEPEDWELFGFEQVNRTSRTVKIYNRAFLPFQSMLGAHPNPTTAPYYVGLVGNSFVCNVNAAQAAIFVVEFL
jgi:hypothetical protein